MASPQPPPGPLGNGSDGNGSADKQQSTSSDAAQPVVELLGGDAYAAVIVCALLLLNMTSGSGNCLLTLLSSPAACSIACECLKSLSWSLSLTVCCEVFDIGLCAAVFMSGGCTC